MCDSKDRVARIMKDLGMVELVQLAKVLDASPQSVSNWKRRGLSKKSAEKLNSIFPQYPIEWLLGSDDEEFQPLSVSESDQDEKEQINNASNYLSIPLYDVVNQDGVSSFIPNKAELEPKVRKTSLPPDGNFQAIKIMDKSLYPELAIGDMIIFNLNDTAIVDGDKYVIWLNNRLFTRRIYRDLDGIILRSDDEKTKDIVIGNEFLLDKRCSIVGKIIWRGGAC